MYKPLFQFIDAPPIDVHLNLISVWFVECDSSYKYNREQTQIDSFPSNQYSAIRTLNGKAKIFTRQGTFTLSANTLILLKAEDIIMYQAASEKWFYYWYEFTCDTPITCINFNTVLPIPIQQDETKRFDELYSTLSYNIIGCINIANSAFEITFFKWVQECIINKKTFPYWKEIKECIKILETDITKKFTIASIAAEFGFSVRYFRQLFTSATGTSPKNYQIRQRMKNGATQLIQSYQSIAQIAENVGYSSQFQFCKDFKKYYGLAPLNYRKEHHHTNL